MVGPNYKPSRIELTSKHAKKWLGKTIKNQVVYKYPQNCLGNDTVFVKGFNNAHFSRQENFGKR